MAPFPIENRAALSEALFAPLAAIVGTHTSMKHAFDWLLGMTPQIVPADAVAQDEYSHDFLFPYPAGCWLVYDCT
ncbi:hypothetical protein [Fimbriiglobus ruber]|uniref:Uncharacterized protein n=1 Tax=Fimbriiglobus ruber TaxID=1908690 RepID=A0A225DSZ3_9BACT|nr:hypothetical protein [Fimbriiglobus ruber]OWK44552.1 hypothetical protein FRUB_02484 [Fimbriiglobus ruber]